MSDVKKIHNFIKENAVKFVDLRFTDTKGKLQHITQAVETVDDDLLKEGIMFDGSSIAGWEPINNSDMILKPDLGTATMDPFSAQPTMILLGDVVDPMSGQPYEKGPRQRANLALEYMQGEGFADTAYFGPEAEFFVFDDVKFKTEAHRFYAELNSEENNASSDADYDFGNSGHRPGHKGGYVPVQPVDSGQDMRSEMLSVMASMGVEIEKHHHEVAPAQHELGIKFAELVTAADSLQHYKYVVHNVAHAYGKTATFMPKPIYGDNGSGMHVHQSLWQKGENLFAGDEYAGLSETALHYIGGILKHAPAINAFTNPTTNSYKRLVPGYEAPVLLAYSQRNRSAACRIPFVSSPKGKRIEIRFPDPGANPYLAFTVMLLAGLDGIKNKIKPGKPRDEDLYALSGKELAKIPHVSTSLRQAMEALQKDNKFLTEAGIFTERYLEDYIALKMEEIERFEHTPHPVEFEMYYSV